MVDCKPHGRSGIFKSPFKFTLFPYTDPYSRFELVVLSPPHAPRKNIGVSPFPPNPLNTPFPYAENRKFRARGREYDAAARPRPAPGSGGIRGNGESAGHFPALRRPSVVGSVRRGLLDSAGRGALVRPGCFRRPRRAGPSVRPCRAAVPTDGPPAAWA